jgi:hypothetical protein
VGQLVQDGSSNGGACRRGHRKGNTGAGWVAGAGQLHCWLSCWAAKWMEHADKASKSEACSLQLNATELSGYGC